MKGFEEAGEGSCKISGAEGGESNPHGIAPAGF